MSDETQRRIAQSQSDYALLKAELDKAHIITGAIITWLEKNQPDVFRRGLHSAVTAAVTTAYGMKP